MLQARAEGYLPKIKVGMSFDEDLRIMKALDGVGVKYALDFNAAYTLDTARDLFREVIGERGLVNAAYVEQPTKASEGIDALGRMNAILRDEEREGIVIADESFIGSRDALECVKQGIALNFKLQKVGGIHHAMLIVKDLVAHGYSGTKALVGGTFPTAIGRAYDQIAACTLQFVTLHSDGLLPSTDYFSRSKHLIKEAFRRVDGVTVPIEGKGLGVTVDEAKIRPFVVEDPRGEYEKIRNDERSERITISLRDGASYRRMYESMSGRSVRWNL